MRLVQQFVANSTSAAALLLGVNVAQAQEPPVTPDNSIQNSEQDLYKTVFELATEFTYYVDAMPALHDMDSFNQGVARETLYLCTSQTEQPADFIEATHVCLDAIQSASDQVGVPFAAERSNHLRTQLSRISGP